ncbi:MAG: ribonuclease J [Dehalococcoidia bacterium]
MSNAKLRVIPLGGLGEIGKNMLLLEYGDDIIVIDAGVMFPEEDMLGVDLVIPDLTYLIERREKVRGVVITHGHEDHIGALPFLLDQVKAPVYASRLTHGLIQVKLREMRRLKEARVREVAPGDVVELGAFSVEFFRVCHSIPDAMGLAIRTPVGMVVHSGDFKFDHTPVDGEGSDLGKLAQLGTDGVLLLLSDSTYAEVPGHTPSEQVVGETLNRVIGQAQGRVIVATFASLISRIQQVVAAAVQHNRRVGIVGRSMVNNVQMATKLGYLRMPPGTFARPDELHHLPLARTVIVTTGSQGEPTSALVRMANKDHKEVSIVAGDTVIISATPIPGNETLVYKTINNLMRQGAHVLYDKLDQVHVHGHAAQEELKTMISLVRPRYFVPIHGEYRHLVRHASLAQSMGVPQEHVFVLEDGDVLELTRQKVGRGEPVTAGPIYVDGLARWDMSTVVLRDRRMLSRDGIVVVFLAVDKQTCAVVRAPELVSYGFLDEADESAVLGKAQELVIESFSSANGHPSDLSFVQHKVKDTLSQYFFKVTKRRPMILPVSLAL